jgi:hypothetical protein
MKRLWTKYYLEQAAMAVCSIALATDLMMSLH